MERTCPLCGRTNRPRAHSCHYCGQKLPPLAEPVPKQGHGFGTFAAFVGVFALLTALLFTGFVTPGFFRSQAEEHMVCPCRRNRRIPRLRRIVGIFFWQED